MKKKFLLVIASIMLILSFTLSFVACKGSNIEGEVDKDAVDFASVLKDYELAPSEAVAATVKYDVASILDSDSYTDEYKAAAAVLFSTGNEIFVNQYAYFKYQVGTTNLGSNRGTLIYQRIRCETSDMKYDTTIKLPINHDFPAIAVNFVADAKIRYVAANHIYHRMKANISDVSINPDTQTLEVAEWKKDSGAWHKEDYLDYGYGKFTDFDQKKIQLDVGVIDETIALSTVKDSLIKEGSVRIEKKEGYYEVYFEANVEAANQDKNTTDALDNDNGGSGIKYDYLKVTLQIWDCGLTKQMKIQEKWNGTIVMYSGAADADTTIKYSYTDRDCLDTTYPDSLVASLCSKSH